MVRALALSLIALLCFTGLARAEIRLAVWNPPGFKYPYIVAVREGENLAQAIFRYQNAVNLNPDLRENLLPQPLKLKLGKTGALETQKDGPKALLMANKSEDMKRAQSYVRSAGKPLQARAVQPYVLPLAAELGLSREEAGEFRKALANEFDLLVGMGGDDIMPSLYREKITYAREPLSLTRDLAERNLVQEFNRAERGFYLGICRGSQMLGVSAGCPMVQDIPKELDVHIHQQGFHRVKIVPGTHLAKIFPGREEVWVNTLHHQSVLTEGNELLRVVARDLNGVVEATELRNGLGMGVQFHPELMDNFTKGSFFDYVAARTKEAFGRRHRVDCRIEFANLTAQP